MTEPASAGKSGRRHRRGRADQLWDVGPAAGTDHSNLVVTESS